MAATIKDRALGQPALKQLHQQLGKPMQDDDGKVQSAEPVDQLDIARFDAIVDDPSL